MYHVTKTTSFSKGRPCFGQDLTLSHDCPLLEYFRLALYVEKEAKPGFVWCLRCSRVDTESPPQHRSPSGTRRRSSTRTSGHLDTGRRKQMEVTRCPPVNLATFGTAVPPLTDYPALCVFIQMCSDIAHHRQDVTAGRHVYFLCTEDRKIMPN